MSRFVSNLTRFVDVFYVWPFSRIMSKNTFRYAVCGGMNMLLGWVLFYVFYHCIIAERYFDLGFMVVSPHTATLYSIVPFTFAAGFYLNRNVAFTRSPLRTRTQLIRYLLSWVISLGINHLLLKLFVEAFGFWTTPSQIAVTLIITFFFSYPMQKYFTFRGCEKV